MKPKKKIKSLLELLDDLLVLAKQQQTISFANILTTLKGKGLPLLMVVFSLPFCTPLQIPGFSTPFGVILVLIGLRIVFPRHRWPNFVMHRQVSCSIIERVVPPTKRVVQFLQKFLHPRLVFFVLNPVFRVVNGLVVIGQALLLLLPLPIPMTNLFAAFPILLMGLGLFEDDGAAILLSYFFCTICLLFFSLVFLFGAGFITHLFGT